ncbi:regulating synaptic membrane exocytosis protein 2-like [Xyrauchen texanus]|uniref:regulating synaptic membrane exocytosis protein 2-like n=1 Tax=Xyrauchen texanus TaxID=154827 RepID=UPI0022421DD5|nr:regulating synaptic membrane exocytosis protein 2-like [Xyrauchen texanus]
MSARGGPAAFPAGSAQPDMPDLSHLTEEERKIILSVMDRQKKEEEKEQSMLKKLHQQFEMYKDQAKKIGEEAQKNEEKKGDSPTCGICHKTKFADGCGHICFYCQTKFCARCGGRVSLRSNKVRLACFRHHNVCSQSLTVCQSLSVCITVCVSVWQYCLSLPVVVLYKDCLCGSVCACHILNCIIVQLWLDLGAFD